MTSPKIQGLFKSENPEAALPSQLLKGASSLAERRLSNWANQTAIKHTVHRNVAHWHWISFVGEATSNRSKLMDSKYGAHDFRVELVNPVP